MISHLRYGIDLISYKTLLYVLNYRSSKKKQKFCYALYVLKQSSDHIPEERENFLSDLTLVDV